MRLIMNEGPWDEGEIKWEKEQKVARLGKILQSMVWKLDFTLITIGNIKFFFFRKAIWLKFVL
jgi:hypothetical protein